MTSTIYLNEKTATDSHPADEHNEVLYLKRLLVTIKQKYEKSVHELQLQLEAEVAKNNATQKELEKTKEELHFYEDEQVSLKQQQLTLKELLKKQQEELKQLKVTYCESDERLEDNFHDLKSQLECAHLQIETLQQELTERRQDYEKRMAELQNAVSVYEEEKTHLDHMPRLSEQMRYELDIIKKTLIQGVQESKSLESRYVDVLNEKLLFEQKVKELQETVASQSDQLSAMTEKSKEFEQQKLLTENQLNEKGRLLQESHSHIRELEYRIRGWDEFVQQRNHLQDKYDQLREEWEQVTKKLEEVLESQNLTQVELQQHRDLVNEQRLSLEEKDHRLFNLNEEREVLLGHVEQLRKLLDDSESRLKVAQQHLAKKVKESSIMTEKMNDQQMQLAEQQQHFETSKGQVHHLQASLELYQRQELKLQEQLHDALKSAESQVSKWEEKYFKMHDRWQEAEKRVRDLLKFEEKYQQMQSLLSNLGVFMGTPMINSLTLTHDAVLTAPQAPEVPSTEKFNMFGMKIVQDGVQPPLSS